MRKRSKSIAAVVLVLTGGLLLLAGEGWYLGAGGVPPPPVVPSMVVLGTVSVLIGLAISLASRKWLLLVALALVFFLTPVVPTNGNLLQLAGLFPRYVSPSCALFRIGVAVGPDSFVGGSWALSPFCNLR